MSPAIRPRRIALFAKDSPLFIKVLKALQAALEALGVQVHAGWPLPDGPALSAFLADWKPDAVLEINRTRRHITDCDRDFLHIAWMHDHRYGGEWLIDRIGDSRLTYFMMPPDLMGVAADGLGPWRYLWPGADPAVFAPRPTAPRWDMTLVGHMYGPLPPALLGKPVVAGTMPCGTVGELGDALSRLTPAALNRGIPFLQQWLADQVAACGAPAGQAGLSQEALSLFDELLPRLILRRFVADAMLRVSGRVRFFGSAGWALWPDYAPHYGGEIIDPQELADIYRATAISPHNTLWPLHFRTLECMACGGFMLINRVDHPDAEAAFGDFVPGDHYMPYDGADIEEEAARALREPARRMTVGERAARRVHERHTWRHRAEQILTDLADL
ncbi:glycosyltransferase family 1 protein [Azospirillum sp. YIM DDC1]|uniref:Glycosyltransferase family 1 protein n=1 Tax=Azospirillum aestuarii TaxID=2802052 RepID=A0ABS1I847_9PROT|nr:glycosyltransferase [Azospirillum aestuarii]MBK4722882.1 glycosyltransferase family 1 protein [Azospirillum aestuarii]